MFFRSAKNVFKSFANQTSMHGFKDLYSANNAPSKIFWLIMLTFAMIMTGLHVAEAVKNFVEQKTTMMIQPAKDNEIIFPHLKLCYPHWLYWADFDKAKSMNFSKPATLFALSHLTRIYSGQPFVFNDARKEFLLSMTSNNFTNLEQFFLAIVNQSAVQQIQINIKSKQVNLSYDLFENMFQIKDRHLCNYVSEETIASKLQVAGDHVAKKEVDKKIYIYNIQNKNFIDFANVVSIEEYRLYVMDWLRYKVPELKSNFSELHDSMPHVVFPIGLSDNGFDIFNSYHTYYVTISASVYKWKNNKMSPCMEGWHWISPNDTCTNFCYENNTFIELSRDFPDYPIYPIIFLDSSTLGDPSSVKEENTVGEVGKEDELQNCFKECEKLVGCHENSFKYSFRRDQLFITYSSSVPNMSTTVVIEYPSSKDILVMTEQNLQTWENFVGNVGGLLGIWTGASIVSFVQTVYLCCCSSADDNSCLPFTNEIKTMRSCSFENNRVPERSETIQSIFDDEPFELCLQ